MKLSYLSLILMLSFILFQFLGCTTEPTEPVPPKLTATVVTGTVNELNQSGLTPLGNCKVSLIATNIIVISYTDSNGVFLDTIITSDASFRLMIEKEGFITIDTLLKRNQVNFLSFTMNKEYINYFPLIVGSKWQYFGKYEPYGDYWWYIYEGEEEWSLTELASDSSWFIIKTDFSGMKIEIRWGTPVDTIYLYNEISELYINNYMGALSLQSISGSDISLLGWFFYLLSSTGITGPKIVHPVSSGDYVLVRIENGFNFLKYGIIKNIGFDSLHIQYATLPTYISSTHLELLDYNIP